MSKSSKSFLMKEVTANILPGNVKIYQKVLSVITVGAFITMFGAWFTRLNYEPYMSTPSQLEKMASISAITFLVSMALLSWLQSNHFKVIKSKKTKLDEREASVRARVFEQSYKTLVILGVVVMLLFSHSISELSQDPERSVHITWQAFFGLMFAITLPRIVASFQNDA